MRAAPASSVAAHIRAMENAGKPPLRPPEHAPLRECDEPFFADIVRERARDEWTGTRLVVAVHLARAQADMEREQQELDTEGTVVVNQRGTSVMNPRVTVLEQLARREMALMRTLQMGGKVAGPAREMAGARAAERQAVEVRDALADEELLAS